MDIYHFLYKTKRSDFQTSPPPLYEWFLLTPTNVDSLKIWCGLLYPMFHFYLLPYLQWIGTSGCRKHCVFLFWNYEIKTDVSIMFLHLFSVRFSKKQVVFIYNFWWGASRVVSKDKKNSMWLPGKEVKPIFPKIFPEISCCRAKRIKWLIIDSALTIYLHANSKMWSDTPVAPFLVWICCSRKQPVACNLEH